MAIEISTDKSRLDPSVIHRFLTESYWAKGILLENVLKRIKNALCFGVYDVDRQVGFARVITDFESFAYIADVFIIEEYRGRGLSKQLVQTIVSHPEIHNLKRIMLSTQDAHGLYSQYGFKVIDNPDKWMALTNPNVYSKNVD